MGGWIHPHAATRYAPFRPGNDGAIVMKISYFTRML